MKTEYCKHTTKQNDPKPSGLQFSQHVASLALDPGIVESNVLAENSHEHHLTMEKQSATQLTSINSSRSTSSLTELDACALS